MKNTVLIEFKNDVDVWEVKDYLNKYRDIKAHVVTTLKIRLYYDEAKIPLKTLIKTVRNASNQDGKKRRNIVAIYDLAPMRDPSEVLSSNADNIMPVMYEREENDELITTKNKNEA
jgi:hypothetical protein